MLQKVITRPAVQMEGLSWTALLCGFMRSALGLLNPRPDVRSSYDGHSAFAASPDLPDAPLLTPAGAGHPRDQPLHALNPTLHHASVVDGCRISIFVTGPMVP